MSKLIVSAYGGAMPAEGPPSRRGFLRGLASLPLIGGAVALIGQPSAVAEPCTEALLLRYLAWLANEHAAVCLALHAPAALAENPERFASDWEYARRRAPLQWFPDAPDIERLVTATPPSTRAALVLSAVGADGRARHV
jgi:hypothetical protein